MPPEGDNSEVHLRANGNMHSNNGSEVHEAEPKPTPFKSPLDRRYHQERSELLGRGNTVSLAGFMNLLFCYSMLVGVGLMLENVNRHGVLVDMSKWKHAFEGRQNIPGFYPGLLLFLYLPVPMLIALGIEKVIAAKRVTESEGRKAHLVNIALNTTYPIVGISAAGSSISFVASYIVVQYNATILLKVWSFVQTCQWAREKQQQAGSTGGVDKVATTVAPTTTEYPANLTVGNVMHFFAAPTLCYELDFPRNPSINWRRMVTRAAWMAVVGVVHLSMLQQWLVPEYASAMKLLAKGEWFVLAERLCKLSIATNVAWLFFFYQAFHNLMLVIAELTRFADRRFYDNWWDAEDMDKFWRRWNLPVHNWCVRHLYAPLLRQGYSKEVARWSTFLFSGLLHEYLASVSLQVFRTFAFWAMLIQGILASVWLRLVRPSREASASLVGDVHATKRKRKRERPGQGRGIESQTTACAVRSAKSPGQPTCGDVSRWASERLGPRWGNAMVWFSLIVGQTLCVVIYTHAYYVTHYGGLDVFLSEESGNNSSPLNAM